MVGRAPFVGRVLHLVLDLAPLQVPSPVAARVEVLTQAVELVEVVARVGEQAVELARGGVLAVGSAVILT